MMVKLTALLGDNATSGLLLDGNYEVHHGPDAQGRVGVFDDYTDSFRTLSRGEYREVPDPREPHDLVRINQQPDGYWAVCACVWRADIAAVDPDEAAQSLSRHLRRMDDGRRWLTTWADPQRLQALNEWRKQQWRRRREPER